MAQAAHTARPVEQAVAGLYSVVYLVSAGVIVHFPQTETDNGHLLAIVELDGLRRRHGGGEDVFGGWVLRHKGCIEVVEVQGGGKE